MCKYTHIYIISFEGGSTYNPPIFGVQFRRIKHLGKHCETPFPSS